MTAGEDDIIALEIKSLSDPREEGQEISIIPLYTVNTI
jgi:hypothetical protein